MSWSLSPIDISKKSFSSPKLWFRSIGFTVSTALAFISLCKGVCSSLCRFSIIGVDGTICCDWAPPLDSRDKSEALNEGLAISCFKCTRLLDFFTELVLSLLEIRGFEFKLAFIDVWVVGATCLMLFIKVGTQFSLSSISSSLINSLSDVSDVFLKLILLDVAFCLEE